MAFGAYQIEAGGEAVAEPAARVLLPSDLAAEVEVAEPMAGVFRPWEPYDAAAAGAVGIEAAESTADMGVRPVALSTTAAGAR